MSAKPTFAKATLGFTLGILVVTALGATLPTIRAPAPDSRVATSHSTSNDLDRNPGIRRTPASTSKDRGPASASPGLQRASRSSKSNASGLPFVNILRPEQMTAPAVVRRFHGVVRARRTSALAALTLGKVAHVLADVGESVAAGDALLELDTEGLQAAVQRGKAELAAARSTLQKMQAGPRKWEIERSQEQVNELASLVAQRQAEYDRLIAIDKGGVVSPRDLDEAKFALSAFQARRKSAELLLLELQEGTRSEDILAQKAVVDAASAALRLQEHNLANATTTAPFGGVIQSRLVEEGEVVSPGQRLFELVDDELELQVEFPPDIARQLRNHPQTRVSVRVAGRKIGASLDRIAPALNDATGTRMAILRFDTQPREVASGQAAEVVVEQAMSAPGLWIPDEALSASGSQWQVFVCIPTETSRVYRIESRQVKLRKNSGNRSSVDVDLPANAHIVGNGLHRIAPGQLVRISESNQAGDFE